MFRPLTRSLSFDDFSSFFAPQLEAAAEHGSRNLFDGFVYMEICLAVASALWLDEESMEGMTSQKWRGNWCMNGNNLCNC